MYAHIRLTKFHTYEYDIGFGFTSEVWNIVKWPSRLSETLQVVQQRTYISSY